MGEYRLSPAAEQDLLEIAFYGLINFGVKQSERYRDALKAKFQNVANNPHQYPAVDHIQDGYRRSTNGVHSIYYLIEGHDVVIMRILGKQDVEGAIDDDL